MTIGILLAVLGAALLHATWNALIKLGTSKLGAMVILSLTEVPLGLAVGLNRPIIGREVWPWLLASAAIHLAYKSFLTIAYRHGDLSRVYPIARGAAPMGVLLVGGWLLADRVTPAEVAGIVILGTGILLMARGVFTGGEERRMLPFALGSAAATAAYTLVDGMGARVAVDALAYVAWMFVLDGCLFSLGALALNGAAILPRRGRDWAVGAAASAASYAAYSISVWAMTHAPIALVAALRETSILFAVLIGWLAFGERLGAEKALSALLIVAGVMVTRL